MFYANTLKRRQKVRRLANIFEKCFEIQRNCKVLNYKIPLLFPKQKIAVEFGGYDRYNTKTINLEKTGIRIFNIPDNEDVFHTAGRLLYVINNYSKFK